MTHEKAKTFTQDKSYLSKALSMGVHLLYPPVRLFARYLKLHFVSYFFRKISVSDLKFGFEPYVPCFLIQVWGNQKCFGNTSRLFTLMETPRQCSFYFFTGEKTARKWKEYQSLLRRSSKCKLSLLAPLLRQLFVLSYLFCAILSRYRIKP